ncbi:MAG: T9SS type A sorting domain-containing protein [Bacteroidetes bacterium]|nr:T9SS type A sorting domain-containing protein [Bacteroidota bacterium]
MKYLLPLIIYFGLGLSKGNSQIVFVKEGGTGDGSSWSSAAGNLKSVLDTVMYGSQVWVAKGTYYPTFCIQCSFTERDISFELHDGVQVFGGFEGNETTVDNRNPVLNKTILSGDIDRDSIGDENSYSVIFTKEVSGTTLLDGVIISGGYADEDNAETGTRYNSGAGWYNEGFLGGESNPTVRNCLFENNFASGYGGGIYNIGSFSGEANSYYQNCSFKNNRANFGGALYNNGGFSGNSSPQFLACTFEENVSDSDGGAIYNLGSESGQSNPSFLDCSFHQNTSNEQGGAICSFSKNGICDLIISNCHFTNNEARNGGAVHNNGGFGGICNPYFSGCFFKGNTVSGSGGGIYNQGGFTGESNPEIINCQFEDNEAAKDGAAIYNGGSDGGASNPIVENCLFKNNIAIKSGGAICNFGKGGTSSPLVRDCHFFNNSARAGGAIYNDGSFGGESSPQFFNCEFVGNFSNSDGGGFYNLGYEGGKSNPFFSNCRFLNNHSTFAGAGLFNNGITGESSPVLINCIFKENEADTYGGGIYNQGKSGISSPSLVNCLFFKNKGSSAGGMYNLGALGGESSPTVTNCTFVGNIANVGGGIYSNASDPSGTSSPVITNCIFYDNQAGFGKTFRNILGTPQLSFSLVDTTDCTSLHSGTGPGVSCGEGMIFAQDPAFMNLGTQDFHLQSNSPAINAGQNEAIDINVDMDSLPRIFHEIVDMGIFEFGSVYYQPLGITNHPENKEVCEGENAVFSVSVEGSGPLLYQWKKNDELLLNATSKILILFNASIQDAGQITCLVKNPFGDSLYTEVAQLTVHPLQTIEVEIEASTLDICDGDIINWQATGGNSGTSPIYQWFVNDSFVGENSLTLSGSAWEDGDMVYCQLTSSEECTFENPVMSVAKSVKVHSYVLPEIEIEASALEICAGDTVIWQANGINAGDTPSYQWYVNNLPAGENFPYFIADSWNDEDEVKSVLTSSEKCTLENPITSETESLVAHPLMLPQIEIDASALNICEGESISFSAQIEHGGENPQLSWMVNNAEIQIAEPSWASETIGDQDVISCQLISSGECLMQNPVTSNPLLIRIQNPLEVSVNVVADSTSICKGDTIAFFTESFHTGNNPAYQWYINEEGLEEENKPFLIISNIQDGDEISCLLLSSEECVENQVAISQTIQMEVIDCTVKTDEIFIETGINIFPNPSNGVFTLQKSQEWGKVSVDIFSTGGKNIYSVEMEPEASNLPIILTSASRGIYWLKITENEKSSILKLILQ